AKVIDCSLYSGGVPIVPWHPYTLASQKALPAGPTEVKIEVFPTSLVLQPGHRLRFSVTTGDLPHQGPNLSTLANSIGGITTLYFGGKTPSSVYLGAVGSSPRPAAHVAGGTASPATGGTNAVAATPGAATNGTAPAYIPISTTTPVSARLPVVGLATAGVALLTLLLAGAWVVRTRRLRRA
ncbi:MAG TPA: CocE/NonD family hydrolase C-terminal non-catalytic domain-containing protein, partial [Candidatus Dormibacteraeota bacterium]